MTKIDYKLLTVGFLLALAVISDLRTYRIRNTITYGFMLSGLISNLITDGMKGMLFSLQGMLLPAICLLLVYIMRAIGAGDVKLLSAVGAAMGPGFILDAMICTFMCGGVMAALLILIRRNGIERLRQLMLYAQSCLLSMKLLEYSDIREKADGSKFHFSLAVASGTAAAMAIDKLGLAML